MQVPYTFSDARSRTGQHLSSLHEKGWEHYETG
jgi:hypothetical protein